MAQTETFKPGMHPWHTKDCNMEFRFERKNVRGYWCETHHQWAYEFGEVKYEFKTER